MALAALISGGKDSLYALYLVLKRREEVRYLVSMLPLRNESWLFHVPNVHLVDLVAESLGIPLVKGTTLGERDSELRDLENTMSTLDVDGIVCGAIASQYQRSKIEDLSHKLGFEFVAPLWGKDPIGLLNEIVRARFDTIITSVAAYGFDEDWLGRRINEETISELRELNKRFGIHPAGEGGEYETLVLDSPMYRRRIEPLHFRKVWKPYSGYLVIDRAGLAEKF